MPSAEVVLITREGYIIPLQVKDGLCYMKMRPPTDEELSSLPHVIMTSDDEWDPSAVDNDGPNLEGIENHADVVRIREQQDRRIDDHGNIIELDIKHVVQRPDREGAVTSAEYVINATQRAGKGQYTRRMVDPQDLIPNFGWKATERIRRTLENTTQNFKATVHIPFRKHQKSRFPAANVTRIQEWWSTDDIKVDQPMPDVGIIHGQTNLQHSRQSKIKWNQNSPHSMKR